MPSASAGQAIAACRLSPAGPILRRSISVFGVKFDPLKGAGFGRSQRLIHHGYGSRKLSSRSCSGNARFDPDRTLGCQGLSIA